MVLVTLPFAAEPDDVATLFRAITVSVMVGEVLVVVLDP